MKKLINFSFLILLIHLLLVSPCFALDSYNGYGGYTVGDTRIIGMGGAYIGVSDDINGILYNPAGIVYSERSFDGKFTRNRIDNYQTDLTNDGKKDGFPLEYWYAGAVIRSIKPEGNFAFGVAYAVPYRAVIDFDDSVTVASLTFNVDMLLDMNISTFSFPLAVQLFPKLSLGAVLNLYTVEEIFQCKYLAVSYDYNQRISKPSVDFGIMYWLTNKLTFGAIFKPSVVFDFDETMNEELDNNAIEWFRDVNLPERLGAGFSYRISDKMSINADVNQIKGQKDSCIIGSDLAFGFNEYKIKEDDVLDYHLGGNYYYRINDWCKMDFRAGGYFEPSRVEGLDDRIHYTGGVEVYLWSLYAGVGYDWAEDFSNLSMIFGWVF